MKKIRSFFLLMALAAFVVGSRGEVRARTPLDVPLSQALVLEGGESSNPRDYDPATSNYGADRRIFSGLVALDPKMNLIPDLAENWQLSNDAMTYVFTLRSNARFHDGRPVTAQDVVYSLERTLDPKTQSNTALTYLGDIVGAADRRAGKADHVSGIRAVDDRHVEIRIDAPKPYFLLKLTYPTSFVLDKTNVESGPDWYRGPNGTGPYKLIEWTSNRRMVYQANPDFYLDAPPIPYIVVNLYSGNSLSLYETGDVDMTGVPISAVDRFLDPTEPMHSELYTGVSLCTQYILFDVSQPPFDDLKVRQAFTMAFDRQKYIDVLYRGHALPAVGLYPPGLPGYNTGLHGIPFDPARARQLLAESKYGGATGLPPILYTSDGYGSYVDPGIAAAAQMWKQYLGVTLQIENLEPDFYSDRVFLGRHGQMLGWSWCADYADAENFADVLFHTGTAHNLGKYSNPALDQLLESARVERDVTKRIQMYQQAEQMIVDDAPMLFTVHPLSHMLVKPYIKGYVNTPLDISFERYIWFEGK